MTCSSVAARLGRVDQCGSEALHPPVQGDVIGLDAALALRQALADWFGAPLETTAPIIDPRS